MDYSIVRKQKSSGGPNFPYFPYYWAPCKAPSGNKDRGIVLGISLTGESIPAGCGAGYQFDIADPSAITGLGGTNQFIVSSTSGTDLGFTYYTGGE